jgi:dihydrofolate reductase
LVIRMLTLKAIAAMSLNRVIGRGNKIPWHLPEDFAWFKKTTMGHILVMGRKTFESIGKPLPGRETIVLSRGGFNFPGVHAVKDLNEIDWPSENRTAFICGGAQIYEQYLPLCSELYLTLVKRVVEGDAFFPRFEDLFSFSEQIHDGAEFSISRYDRLGR